MDYIIVFALLLALALVDNRYARRASRSTVRESFWDATRVPRRTPRESYWPLSVFLLFLLGLLMAAMLNNFLLVPIVVIPVTLFAWLRYWAADRSSQNGDR